VEHDIDNIKPKREFLSQFDDSVTIDAVVTHLFRNSDNKHSEQCLNFRGRGA